MLEGLKLFKSNIEVSAGRETYFKCIVYTRPINTMVGTVTIEGMDIKKYLGTVNIRKNGYYKFKSHMETPGFNSIALFKGNITIRKDSGTKYSAHVQTPLLEDLSLFKGNIIIRKDLEHKFKGNVTIPPSNRMFGKITSIESPRHKFYGMLKKDTHVIETLPASNFGGQTELYFNNKSIVYLQWSFNSNDDDMYDHINETQAFLRLYLKKAVETESTVYIYSTDTSWQEYSLNYNNKPPITPIAEYTIPANRVGSYDMPLGDLLKSYTKLDGTFDVSLAVVIDSDRDTASNSRETAINIPALYYEYYIIPPTMRQKLFTGTINIIPQVNKFYKSTINIIHPSDYAVNTKKFGGTIDVLTQIDKNHVYKSFIDIPIFESGNNSPRYRGIVAVVPQRSKFYNGFVEIPKTDTLLKYKASITVGVDKLPIFKSMVNIPLYENQSDFKATVTIVKDGFAKFNAKLEVPIFNNKHQYSAVTTVRLDRLSIFKSTVQTHSQEEQVNYKGTLLIPYRINKTYESTIKIDLFKKINKYSSTVIVRKDEIRLFKGIVWIPADKRRIRIFVM